VVIDTGVSSDGSLLQRLAPRFGTVTGIDEQSAIRAAVE
jgi:hypothetical protein